jgi:hypothetical protein
VWGCGVVRVLFCSVCVCETMNCERLECARLGCGGALYMRPSAPLPMVAVFCERVGSRVLCAEMACACSAACVVGTCLGSSTTADRL